MKDCNRQHYVSPEMQVVNIEVEQAILNGSNTIENIGGRKEDIDW